MPRINDAHWRTFDDLIRYAEKLNMSHEINYDPNIGYVVLRVEGIITIDQIRKIAPEVARICMETGCNRLLNDMSQAIINIPIVELFDSPKIMDESGVSRTIKRALVVPPSFKESDFLENVSQNRGHNLMVYKDLEEAKKWLIAE